MACVLCGVARRLRRRLLRAASGARLGAQQRLHLRELGLRALMSCNLGPEILLRRGRAREQPRSLLREIVVRHLELRHARSERELGRRVLLRAQRRALLRPRGALEGRNQWQSVRNQ